MSAAQPAVLELDSVLRPLCPKCGMKMWLARIEPDRPGHDKRMFDCTNCGHAENVVVNIK